MSCAAPEQGGPSPATARPGQTVIEGRVITAGRPVASAFVRLLDGTGEFTAEVVAGLGGEFRFFAAPGTWTVRALCPGAEGSAEVLAAPGVTTIDVPVTTTVPT